MGLPITLSLFSLFCYAIPFSSLLTLNVSVVAIADIYADAITLMNAARYRLDFTLAFPFRYYFFQLLLRRVVSLFFFSSFLRLFISLDNIRYFSACL